MSRRWWTRGTKETWPHATHLAFVILLKHAHRILQVPCLEHTEDVMTSCPQAIRPDVNHKHHLSTHRWDRATALSMSNFSANRMYMALPCMIFSKESKVCVRKLTLHWIKAHRIPTDRIWDSFSQFSKWRKLYWLLIVTICIRALVGIREMSSLVFKLMATVSETTVQLKYQTFSKLKLTFG